MAYAVAAIPVAPNPATWTTCWVAGLAQAGEVGV
jgi:hypothetical protein